MSRRRAPIDVAALDKPLRHIARRLGRYFPTHLMDQDDLMQQGYLGVLSVKPQTKEAKNNRIKRQVTAAKYEMIDALRAFHDRRFPNGRKRERLISDAFMPKFDARDSDGAFSQWRYLSDSAYLHDRHNEVLSTEDIMARESDLRQQITRLPPRERLVILERLRGETLADIAEQLGVNESRVCQIQARIVEKLQEAA